MRLVVYGPLSPLGQQWHDAIAPVIVRHPNPAVTIVLTLRDVELVYSLDGARDSRDPARAMPPPFNISTVRLTYFPGVALARMFVAAMHASYLVHEALELTTVGDLVTRVGDPHEPAAGRSAFAHSVRIGMPPVLTRESLAAALTVIVSHTDAQVLACS